MKKYDSSVWVPVIVAFAFVAGLFCSVLLHKDSGRSLTEKKLGNIFNIIESEYVEEVDIDSLIEATLPSLLSNLDPHSVYIPASDLQQVNEELEGSFSGVGVSFTIDNDTIFVIESISGGPSERVGIKAGDRIIEVDGQSVAGIGITNDSVFSKLRGETGTIVNLTVKRSGASQPLHFEVERGEIPIKSIDAEYIISPKIGYVKINKFGRTTYDEFWQSLNSLSESGAEDFIIDLRGNPGGLLDAAVLMANEFLPAGFKIVETKGRKRVDNTVIMSDGMGAFQNSRVIILLDEFSASSSEVLAGAIQDNDRGLIIGRRSFGKGLVQHQIDLPDNSAMRITVARYYTPSVRCIQKDYSDAESYQTEIIERYNRGEAYDADSIKFDESMQYATIGGRTVYGGGGIMPDIFIPNDTLGYTGYFMNVVNAGLLQKFSLKYADENRQKFEEAGDVDDLLQLLGSDYDLLRSFVRFASDNGIAPRWYYINISRDLIVNQLKALIARDILGIGAYYQIVNVTNPVVVEAIKCLKAGDADFPIVNKAADEAKVADAVE